MKEPSPLAINPLVNNNDLAMLEAVLQGRVSRHGNFIVARDIDRSTSSELDSLKEGVPERLRLSEGVGDMALRGVSLINSREGVRLVAPWLDRLDELEERLDTVIDDLPTELEGFLGRAVVLGKIQNPMRGMKHVVFNVDTELHNTIRKERQQLFKSMDLVEPVPQRPHIGVFKTENLARANSLKDSLNVQRRWRRERVPVMLHRVTSKVPHQI